MAHSTSGGRTRVSGCGMREKDSGSSSQTFEMRVAGSERPAGEGQGAYRISYALRAAKTKSFTIGFPDGPSRTGVSCSSRTFFKGSPTCHRCPIRSMSAIRVLSLSCVLARPAIISILSSCIVLGDFKSPAAGILLHRRGATNCFPSAELRTSHDAARRSRHVPTSSCFGP